MRIPTTIAREDFFVLWNEMMLSGDVRQLSQTRGIDKEYYGDKVALTPNGYEEVWVYTGTYRLHYRLRTDDNYILIQAEYWPYRPDSDEKGGSHDGH
jgi:hypothetical protein